MADILFRGIKIPESCIECDFTCERRGQYYCIFQTEEQNETALTLPELYKNCPLRLGALPEGHGDLIDRDALRPDMVGYIAGGYGTDGSICALCGYSHQKIDNAPTIIPAEGCDNDGK